MFVAIPFHPAIPTDYAELAKTILKSGTNPNHTLAVASLRQHDEEAYLFGNSLSEYFGRHAKISIDDREEDLPKTSNRFFTAILRAFDKYKPSATEAPNSPLLYFDPSYRPASPRWLDDLQADYFRCGAPMVFGSFSDTNPPQSEGPIMFSKSFLNKSALLDFMPPDIRWRDYLAWEMKKNSVKAGGIGTHDSAVLVPAFEV